MKKMFPLFLFLILVFFLVGIVEIRRRFLFFVKKMEAR